MEDSESICASNNGMVFGIPDLDAAERRLTALVHELNHALADGRDREEIQRLMNQILADALDHFEQEERVLFECAYPSPKGHAALHRQMRAELEHAMNELRKVESRAMWAEFGLLVSQLVVEHIRQETMKYRNFLHSRSRSDAQGK